MGHPHNQTRDTGSYGPLRELAGSKRPSLKTLARKSLGIDIQEGEHSSVTDARATMAIYRTVQKDWEAKLRGATKGPKKLKLAKEATLIPLQRPTASRVIVKKAGPELRVDREAVVAGRPRWDSLPLCPERRTGGRPACSTEGASEAVCSGCSCPQQARPRCVLFDVVVQRDLLGGILRLRFLALELLPLALYDRAHRAGRTEVFAFLALA